MVTTPVQLTWPTPRSAATTATSVPASTKTAPQPAASVANSCDFSHCRRSGRTPSQCSSCSPRTGGLTTNRAMPARTSRQPTEMTAAVVDTFVAISTPTAGPTMNDISNEIESSENAVRRCSGGTSADSAWRPTDITGRASTPPTNDMTSSAGYGSSQAVSQYAP